VANDPSCSFPETFAIEVRSRPKSRQKACFSAPNFFGGGGPANFRSSILKLHPFPIMWKSFAAIGRQTAEISRWIKKRKRKKETAAKHIRARALRCRKLATGGPNKLVLRRKLSYAPNLKLLGFLPIVLSTTFWESSGKAFSWSAEYWHRHSLQRSTGSKVGGTC